MGKVAADILVGGASIVHSVKTLRDLKVAATFPWVKVAADVPVGGR